LTTWHDMFKMSIIEPFRATVYITRASPSRSVQRFGTESFITVRRGEACQTYNGANLTLVLVTWSLLIYFSSTLLITCLYVCCCWWMRIEGGRIWGFLFWNNLVWFKIIYQWRFYFGIVVGWVCLLRGPLLGIQ